MSSAYGPNVPGGWQVDRVADMDLDGNPDYVLRNIATGSTAVYYLHGAVYSSSSLGPTVPAGWKVIAARDVDHDGNQDYILFSPMVRTNRSLFP